MKIVGPPSALRSAVLQRLNGLNPAPLFTEDIFPAVWDAGLHYGIDPVGLVAQSYKETGAGRFTGNVRPKFYNTAGIKVRHTDLFPGSPTTTVRSRTRCSRTGRWARSHRPGTGAPTPRWR